MPLIIHHWDTDGITSAALLIRALNLEEFTNMTAPIGEFRFDERIRAAVKNAERLYVLDFNVPHEVEKVKVPTLFVDHHTQPKINNPLVEQVKPLPQGRVLPLELARPLGALRDMERLERPWSRRRHRREGI
ncbi:DHH family phosphoesterase [Thermococcus stetteri]|uniref:DHH family phosphoesterase n=1 Tax=Thermococcus stetteri TaxID=49900 RepID=UPI003158B9D9|nr:single-stranded DNA-specific DHH superfamily exonuclease [Thermococcus stetteri]